jgi:hypothetical protein
VPSATSRGQSTKTEPAVGRNRWTVNLDPAILRLGDASGGQPCMCMIRLRQLVQC